MTRELPKFNDVRTPKPSPNRRYDWESILVICILLPLIVFPGIVDTARSLLYEYIRSFLKLPSTPPSSSMSWNQTTLTLPSRARGSYLITDTILKEVPQIREYKVGLLNLFIQHTSCALSLNENWDEDVRADMSDALDRVAPEDSKGAGLYRHSAEGPDDMPAHIKSALIGASVTIPIKDGKLQTGTWQGIWYLEFRAYKHTRKVVATIQGEKA